MEKKGSVHFLLTYAKTQTVMQQDAVYLVSAISKFALKQVILEPCCSRLAAYELENAKLMAD